MIGEGIEKVNITKKIDNDGIDLEVIKSQNDGYISEGTFGDVSTKYFKIGNHEIELVEKKPKTGKFSEKEIERQLDIHEKLKKAKVNTFITFRTDGKSLYSTPLNKNGIIALSANNKTPESYIDRGESFLSKLLKKERNLYIKNFDELLNNLIMQSELAAAEKILLASDSVFYLVNENHGGKPSIVDFLIGDFDIVKYIDRDDSDEVKFQSSLLLLQSLLSFIRKYAQVGKIEEYNSKIQNKIDEIVLEMGFEVS